MHVTPTYIKIQGRGFVTGSGYGSGTCPNPDLKSDPELPKGKEIFTRPLMRYGRFDRYTRLGCAGIALAVKNAGLADLEQKSPVALLLSTRYECYGNDIAYYQTTREASGAFSSPNLFSYTLPGIVLGEMAIHFKFSGPTLILGESDTAKPGIPALREAANLLAAGTSQTVVCGWLDSPPPEMDPQANRGAFFVVLKNQKERGKSTGLLWRSHGLFRANESEISSILDLF